MSWDVSGEVTTANHEEELKELNPTRELGEGAKKQLEAAKKCAADLIPSISGDTVRVSITGHSHTDEPGSGLDHISVAVYALSATPI